jgi:hypothetical protein
MEIGGCRGRDCMIVWFTTTYAISAYRCEFESFSGEVYSIQHYVIKFVSDFRQVIGFLQVPWLPPIKPPVKHHNPTPYNKIIL